MGKENYAWMYRRDVLLVYVSLTEVVVLVRKGIPWIFILMGEGILVSLYPHIHRESNYHISIIS
jgi:hypothetical protein